MQGDEACGNGGSGGGGGDCAMTMRLCDGVDSASGVGRVLRAAIFLHLLAGHAVALRRTWLLLHAHMYQSRMRCDALKQIFTGSAEKSVPAHRKRWRGGGGAGGEREGKYSLHASHGISAE